MSAAIVQCSARVTQPQPAVLSRAGMHFEVITRVMRTGSTAATCGSPPVEPNSVRSTLPLRSKPASNRSGSSLDGP